METINIADDLFIDVAEQIYLGQIFYLNNIKNNIFSTEHEKDKLIKFWVSKYL